MGSQHERAIRKPAQPAAEAVEQFFQVSLLGLLVSGFLALAFSGYLDVLTIVLTSARASGEGGCGVWANARTWGLSTPIANALTLAYIGFYPLDTIYLSREFIPATVHLICFLAVIRVLSARTNRDYFFVKVLAFLELVAATLLSSNITFFVFLTTFVVFGVATFCCSEIRRSSQQGGGSRWLEGQLPWAAGRSDGRDYGRHRVDDGRAVHPAARTARAAFRSLVPERYHVTGFANEISLGQLGRFNRVRHP